MRGRDCKSGVSVFAGRERLKIMVVHLSRAFGIRMAEGQNCGRRWRRRDSAHHVKLITRVRTRESVIGNKKSTNREERVIKDLLAEFSGKSVSLHEECEGMAGVSRETTTGVHRLYKMHQETVLFRAITLMIRSQIEIDNTLWLPAFAG